MKDDPYPNFIRAIHDTLAMNKMLHIIGSIGIAVRMYGCSRIEFII